MTGNDCAKPSISQEIVNGTVTIKIVFRRPNLSQTGPLRRDPEMFIKFHVRKFFILIEQQATKLLYEVNVCTNRMCNMSKTGCK